MMRSQIHILRSWLALILRDWLALILGRSTTIDHSQRRNVRLIQNSATTILGRGLGMIVSLLTVPLTITYLGTERFGLWITISTLLAWVQLADFGLGSGLTNALSRAYGTDRPDLAQTYVATTFWLLVAIGASLAAVSMGLMALVDWKNFFQVQSATTAAELSLALRVALLLTGLSMPFVVVDKIWWAYQEGSIANGWAALGSLASLGALLLVIVLRGGLVELVLAFAGSQTLVKSASAVWLFTRHKPWIAPKPSCFERGEVRALSVVGVEFFVLQIAALVLFQSDNLVIAHFLGASAVAEYNVVYQIFAQVLAIQALLLTPLWPAYSEAMARNDLSWIRSSFRRNLLGHLVIFGSSLALLCLAGQQVIYYWTGRQIVANQTLIVLMMVWSMIVVWGNNFSYLLNGLGIIRAQALIAVLMATINLGLSLLWVQQIGSHGVILATIVAYSLTSLWMAPILVKRKLQLVR